MCIKFDSHPHYKASNPCCSEGAITSSVIRLVVSMALHKGSLFPHC